MVTKKGACLGRPRMCRRVRARARSQYFKPNGIPGKDLTIVELTHEELEALRLKNVSGFDQTKCAQEMHTSQSTFQRILSSAYVKMSDALVNGKGIKIVN